MFLASTIKHNRTASLPIGIQFVYSFQPLEAYAKCDLDRLGLVSTSLAVLLLVDDLADTSPCLALGLCIDNRLDLVIETRVAFLGLPCVGTVLTEEHFNLFNGLAAGLSTVSQSLQS